MIPLAERNWVAMVVAFLVLLLTGFASVLLWSSVSSTTEVWVWLTAGVMTLAGVLSLAPLISGDTAWMLVSLIVSRNH